MRRVRNVMITAALSLVLACMCGAGAAYAEETAAGKAEVQNYASDSLSHMAQLELFGKSYQDLYGIPTLDMSRTYLADGIPVYVYDSGSVVPSKTVYWPVMYNDDVVAAVEGSTTSGLNFSSGKASAVDAFIDAEGECAIVKDAQTGDTYLVSDTSVSKLVYDAGIWTVEAAPEMGSLCESVNPVQIKNQTLVTVRVIKGSSSANEDGPGLAYVVNSWVRMDGKAYFVDGNGDIARGWQRISDDWFYFNPSTGLMSTGWIKPGKVWYYLAPDGAMATGWRSINNVWYYFNSSGAMQTGWIKPGKVWYYLAPSGAMQTGWEKVNGYWYYFSGSGAMQTGWEKVGNTWYYLNTASNTPGQGPQGAMVCGGTYKINGVYRTFASSGAWIR